MGWWRKKKPKPNLERGTMLLKDLIKCCDGKSNPIKFFSAHQICEATNNFSESNEVSEFSDFCNEWYSGKVEHHPMILIKMGKLKFEFQGEEFCRDIAISSMVSGHKNFMKLVGCCLEFEYPVMVYHGVKKHYNILQHMISRQPWKRRMKIAEDIATALAYLHTAFPRPFVYRNMWLDNILLDEDGVAKLKDFSYCVSIPKGQTFVKVDRSYFSDIYKDSKYMRDGIVSVETDVHAIGMLMQLLLHGFKNVQRRLVEEGTMDEIADPKMVEMMGEISEEELSRMKAFLMLSQRCISEVEVPTMVEVAKELKKIQRSLRNDSSSPSGDTQFVSPQDIASSSSQTTL